ncbi:hypothetical protein [Nannocystis exedens]|nr:hypothetical protein [Nannocystis exedens]
MDAQLRWLEQEAGRELREPTWLMMYPDDATIDACLDLESEPVAGCWDAPVVHTTWGAASHELGHAYAHPVRARPLNLLQEGLAEATEGTVHGRMRGSREKLGDYLFEPVGTNTTVYEAAGHFVRWLLEEYGMTTTLEMYARTRPGMSEAELSAVCEDVLGVAREGLLAGYVTDAKDYYPGVGPFACGQGAEALEWHEDGVSWEGEMSCDDGHSIGRYLANGEVEFWRRWRVEVPVTAMYEVTTSADGGAMTRCLTTPIDEASLPAMVDGLEHDWWGFGPLYRPPGIGTQVPLFQAPILLEAGVYDFWIAERTDEHLLGEYPPASIMYVEAHGARRFASLRA